MNVKIGLGIISTVLFFSGLGLIVWADWRIALGMFLFIWGNNLALSFKKEK